TLPVLARWLVGREGEIGARVGALYAANTLGACAGTAAATYVLLPEVGVRASELVAVGLNLVAGLSALVLARRGSRTPAADDEIPASVEAAAPTEPPAGPRPLRATLA